MTEKVQKIRERLAASQGEKVLLKIALAMLVLLIVFIIILLSTGVSGRTAVYKDVSGAAGLDAAISYDCSENCDYNFNVYIFTEDGQQVNVVRPNNEGHVQLALAEGKYVMLVGKQFGGEKVFPQEPLELKNGKVLELKLQYR